MPIWTSHPIKCEYEIWAPWRVSFILDDRCLINKGEEIDCSTLQIRAMSMDIKCIPTSHRYDSDATSDIIGPICLWTRKCFVILRNILQESFIEVNFNFAKLQITALSKYSPNNKNIILLGRSIDKDFPPKCSAKAVRLLCLEYPVPCLCLHHVLYNCWSGFIGLDK